MARASSDLFACHACLKFMRNPLSRLPSLDLLRGFVAVARRMSITQAAEDLHLTQSAVSRQVKGLEDHLQLPLFTRQHRAIALTPEGERLFRVADACLSQLGEALDGLKARAEPAPVTITATIGMTALWLLPLLGRFQQAHPAIDVRVAASNRVIDLSREGVDLALRYGPGDWAAIGGRHLFDEHVLAVASPSLGLHGLPGEQALAQAVLLDHEDMPNTWLRWPDWLRASGFKGVRPRGRLGFNQYDQVIYAAVAGQGLALGRLPLIEPMLQDGRLVVLPQFRPPEMPDHAYWLVRREGELSPAARVFGDWLEAAALGTRDGLQAFGASIPG